MISFTSPYHALSVLAELSRQQARGLPQQSAFEATWTGVGFRIGQHTLVTPMQQISEILTPPPATRLPGVKDWVVGVSNVRGRLVPVVDLCSYLDLPHEGSRQGRRILIVELDEILVGLLVDQVSGMQYFSASQRLEDDTAPVAVLTDYLDGAYEKNRQHWHVFSMEKLISQHKFMQVAA